MDDPQHSLTPAAHDGEHALARMRALLDRPLPPEEIRANTELVAASGETAVARMRSILVFAVGGEHFALEVKGDSMIDAGIFDGDTVIIRKGDTAHNGDIVVALVDDEEATLKRLRRKGDSVALEAANTSYETRIFGPDRVRVQGRLIGLMRKY